MAVNFGLIAQAPTFVQRFAEGQQAAAAEQDRNLLRKAQMEQMAAQRENMLAQRQDRQMLAAERQAKIDRMTRNQTLLTGLGQKLAENGYRLDRTTLGQMLSTGQQTGEENLVKLAVEGLRALDETERDKAEMARIAGGAPAAARAPAAPVAAPARAAGAPNELLAGTPFAVGMNALAAPPAAPAAPAEPMAGGFTRSQIGEMLASESKGVRARGEQLSKLLPKEVQPQVRTLDTGAEILTEEYNPSTGVTRVLSRQKKAMSPAEIATDIREAKRIGLETRRVAIAEENAKRDADPAFQQRMAAARATGDAIAKGDVAAQRALPQVIGRAEQGLRLIDELIGKAEVKDASGKVVQPATRPHPGFQNAVGATWLPGARFVPGTDAADFMARFDQINGQAFLEAFESLKGGGAITEKEGAKGTEAINRARIAQSEREFIAAMRDLQSVVRKGVENARSKSLAAPAAGSPATAPNIDALLNKYR